MLASWNVRGFNNSGKLREISSRLPKIKPDIMIYIETRVKENKAEAIREKLKLHDRYIDNYNKHANGRLWISWNAAKNDIKLVSSTDQAIHCRVYDNKGAFIYYLTAVYAHNLLAQRKLLWKTIEKIHT